MANQGSTGLRRSSWAARLGLIVVGLLLGGAVVVYSTLYFGVIQGEEFSPQTFRRRQFFYYEVPLVGLQVSPITHTDKTGKLEELLVKKKMVAVQKGKNVRWDLVIGRHGDVVSSVGDAQILCNYLASTEDDEAQDDWLNWTEEHAELGKILWPVIANLARQELYIFVPDLMFLAEQASSPEQLNDALDKALTKKYLELAQVQQSMGRHELAIELYSGSLDHSPEQIDALQGRAKSLDTVGKKEEADADRALAREIQSRF